MAQAQDLCDLAQRGARELEPAHRSVELGASDVSSLFGVDDAGFGCPGLTEQIGIDRHASTVSRHKANGISVRLQHLYGRFASSSRSQLAVWAVRTVLGLICEAPSTGVRWRPPLHAAIVTHLGTRVQVGLPGRPRRPDLLIRRLNLESWRPGHMPSDRAG